MKANVIKLCFNGPVHFGKGRLSDANFTCDAATLFSAFFIEALKMDLAENLLRAAKDGDFSISDAFPYIGNTLYLPKPMLSSLDTTLAIDESSSLEKSDSRSRKAAKKLQYVPAQKLSAFCQGDFDFIRELECFHLGKSLLRTKVSVSRDLAEDAEPYHVGSFSYAPGCGIYFIYQGAFDIYPLLDSLSISGLGGKRSSGYGAFSFHCEEVEMQLCDVAKGGKRMLLSSAMPCECELTDELLEQARYSLVEKTGFVQSTQYASTPRKKRDLWVFAPGSIFEQPFKGDVFDVNDMLGHHAVYRYARALWLEV